MRAKIIIIFLLAFASAQALVVDSLPQRMAWATARVRMRAPGLGATSWTATLGDSSQYIRVRIDMPQFDEIIGRRCSATAVKAQNGNVQPLGRADFNSHSGEASVRIVYDGYSARLYAGDTSNTLICRLDSLCPGPLSVDGDAVLVDAWARCLPLPTPEYSRFSSVDALMAYLADSDDIMEGVWTYLDRDIDPARASLGAYYNLATGRNGGGYDIINLSPAGIWQPLQIKGTLTPTIFIGNYDLGWSDSAGVAVGDEANAQFTPDGAILTLRFPLLGSQLRFRRAVTTASE